MKVVNIFTVKHSKYLKLLEGDRKCILSLLHYRLVLYLWQEEDRNEQRHVVTCEIKPETPPSTNRGNGTFELISHLNSDVSIFLNTDWSALLLYIKILGNLRRRGRIYVHEFLWAAASEFRHLGRQCMINGENVLYMSSSFTHIDVPHFNCKETSTVTSLVMELWSLPDEYSCVG